MADNFNLRTFLTENKLTKNAKLLKEQEELSYPFGEFGQGVKDIFKHYNEEAISDAPDIVFELIDELIQEYDLDPMSGEIDTDPMEARLLELYKAAQTMDTEKFGEFAYNELSDGSLFIGGEEDDDLDEISKYDLDNEEWEAEDDYPGQTKYVSRRDIEEDVNEANYSDSYNTPAAKAVNAKANQIVGTIRGYSTALQTIQDAIKQVEQEVGSEVTRSEKRTLENHLMWMFRREMEMEREGVSNKKPVMETKQSKREKYLTRLVENALGIDITEDDNVDYTMGRQDDPNQLPNPAPELNIPEGEDMVQEKPLPKYENIEKLMQEIEKNTDEESHKFKIAEMKRVADGLEKKATALEEGDNAEHIDQKKLKQMKKDIMTLRKGIEKMEKLGEKKFTKKETKAELKEGFDLRNFLVENKLTRNSRMLNENADIQQAFSEAGLTGMVTVLFQSDSNIGEPDIKTMPAERALRLVASKAANAESVIVVQANEITQGEQIGDYEEETEGLTCKLIVEILDKGVYEIWQ